ncbi:MAG: hemolysin family protein [Candidatus Electryonea clarkiae]|nr:hemolysin family protein [Candidatus Electryonea clarkiae]MDP8289156.1 hemolysin family protein [Candidatus Electryonea clarkiae]
MDSSNLWLPGLIFLGLLILSAFFSGSETAFFSMSKAALRKFRENKDSRSERVVRLIDKPRELLIAILIGNTVVNTSAASLAAIVTDNVAHRLGFNPVIALLLDIVVVTFILVVAVEITPKVFAFKNNERWVLLFSVPIQICVFVFKPLTKVFVVMVDRFARYLGMEAQHALFNEEELRTLAQVGEEHGVLEEEEREMITSIFEFGETEVHEIMVPRVDMTTINANATMKEAADIVNKMGHSRIPVYEDDIDHIIGVLYAKDLIGKAGENRTIRELIREAYFVPESKLINSLLREFQKANFHIAVVVDEYGGTEGIITLEDVIEEIVGEIHDEFDREEVLFKQMENGEISVAAKIEVEDFNTKINEKLVSEDEDYETLGGFIFALAGEVPEAGQSYTYHGWKFLVAAIEANRVVHLMVTPPDDADLASDQEDVED